MVSDVELAIERLSALRTLGVQIAIDDFGTGYSSLNYILRLPIDVPKIEKHFIDSVDADNKESRLTAVIIGLAGVLGLRCIAEGVQRPAQHERLKDLGCDYAQGFLLARPMRYGGFSPRPRRRSSPFPEQTSTFRVPPAAPVPQRSVD